MNARKIVLNPEEQLGVNGRVDSSTASNRDRRSARLIQLAAQGYSWGKVARLTGFSLPTVTCWCLRFQTPRLNGMLDQLSRRRKTLLPADAVCCVPEQVTLPRAGEPRLNCRNIARASKISAAIERELWAANDLKPHLVRTLKLSDYSHFEDKLLNIIGLYLAPLDKAFVLHLDEKNKLQALVMPLDVGHIHSQSHDHIRHSIGTLFTALNYFRGRLLSHLERQHSHQE